MLPPAFYNIMEDKIKLEEELEFLKESFEAEVISKEEYERVKARIEAQLIEKKKEPEIEIKEIKEPSRFKEESREIEELEKEEDTNDILNSKKEFRVEKEKKKISKWVPIAAFVFLIVIGYFSFLFFTGEKGTDASERNTEEVLSLCFSDSDCVREGMIGFCSNAGSKDAKCEFKEDTQVNFIVLTTKDCFNCDTSRVEKIIKGWFPGAVKKEIEINPEEGKPLVKNLSIELLPAYIFDSNLENAFRFKELKGIFSKVSDKYVLSSGASGSTFYINKKEIPNRLDAFLMKNDSSTEKAEENIKGFLDSFKNKIEYNKHLVDKEDSLVKSLDINTFPTFLINNKIRFSGIQSAETIKENFCKMNKLEECNKKLTENLV